MDKKVDDKKINNYKLLPEYLKVFLSSNTNGAAISWLSEKYKIDKEVIYGLINLLINSGFDFSLLKEKINKLDLTGVALNNFWFDFLGSICLPISPYLEINSEGRIRAEKIFLESGGRKDNYSKWIKDFESEALDVVMEIINEAEEELNEKIDIKYETSYIIDLLSKDLIDTISSEDFNSSSLLNRWTIYFLSKDNNFKDELLRSVLNNKELITKKEVEIEGLKSKLTVSCLLKDFIKKNGSVLFDDIVLIEYLDKSTILKSLNFSEKELAGKVIRFYKNIAFFPECFSNKDIEEWKIFNFKNNKEEVEVEKDSFKKVEKIKEENLIETASPEKSEESEELKTLKRMLENYPPTSLERKAIEGEIRKMLNK